MSVIDARFLNERMAKDHFISPNPNELLYEFTTENILSTMDLTSTYWQIRIKEERNTVFSFEGRTYVYKVFLLA